MPNPSLTAAERDEIRQAVLPVGEAFAHGLGRAVLRRERREHMLLGLLLSSTALVALTALVTLAIFRPQDTLLAAHRLDLLFLSCCFILCVGRSVYHSVLSIGWDAPRESYP